MDYNLPNFLLFVRWQLSNMFLSASNSTALLGSTLTCINSLRNYVVDGELLILAEALVFF